jgi:hypothetical protein
VTVFEFPELVDSIFYSWSFPLCILFLERFALHAGGNATINDLVHKSLDNWFRVTCNDSNVFNEECRGFTQVSNILLFSNYLMEHDGLTRQARTKRMRTSHKKGAIRNAVRDVGDVCGDRA